MGANAESEFNETRGENACNFRFLFKLFFSIEEEESMQFYQTACDVHVRVCSPHAYKEAGLHGLNRMHASKSHTRHMDYLWSDISCTHH